MKATKAFSFLLSIVLLFGSLQVACAWELERPGGPTPLWKSYRAENAGTNGEASVGLCVSPSYYVEDAPSPYNGDVVWMNMSMTTNSRRGISYEYSNWPWNEWYSESSLALRKDRPNVGDEWGEWFSVSSEFHYFSFYGAYYKKLYVSSNGFISVNDANMTSSSRQSMPNSKEPNGIIAGCWADFVIDSLASIHVGEYYDVAQRIWFVVIWKNALHKKSGTRATFEIAISNRIEWFQESKIRFNYQHVDANNEQWNCGIEDQEGVRGWSDYWNGYYPLQSYTFDLVQASNTFFLKCLALKMQDENLNTKFDILDANDDIRGCNVECGADPQPDNKNSFFDVLSTGKILLTEGLGGFLVAMLWAGAGELWNYARSQYNDVTPTVIADQKGSTRRGSIEIPRGAWIQVPPDYSLYGSQVDASLCIHLWWILTEAGMRQNHALTISANSTYDVYDRGGAWLATRSVVTSVTLKIGPDNNNDPTRAVTINSDTTYERLFIGKYDEHDYYRTYAGQGQTITAHAWKTPPAPAAPAPYMYVRIYDPSGNPHGSSDSRTDVTFSATTDCAGLWIIEVYRGDIDSYGFYSLNVVVGDGSGGCPILSVFNGTGYVEEGLLNIHNPNCTDVVMYRALSTAPEPEAGRYLLRLTEHPQTHSYIDQVKLYATLSDETMIQLPLVSATHSEYGNVLLQLWFSDDWRTDTLGANFNNGTSQSIDLKFLALPPFMRIESFTFMIEGHNFWSKT
jgi:hypothetical protein